MPTAHSVPISLPEGQRLADLAGISHDLRSCEDFIMLYKALLSTKRSRHTHDLIDCVVTSIFIRYARCFSGGVRRKREELTQIMDADDLRVHQLTMHFRDKHFAHSVNNCESPTINVVLLTDAPERKLTNVSASITTMVAPDMFVFDNLSILVGKLRAWVIEEEKTESKRLLSIVEGKFTLDELYAHIGKSHKTVTRIRDVSKGRKGT